MPYKWLLVALLWFVCFFNYADRQAIFSVFPLLKSEMGLTDTQLGIVGSAFAWVYALAGPLAGMVGDRVKPKTLIIGGLSFWSLVTAGTALSTDYTHLVLCRALEGLGESFYFPASMALISRYHDATTRSRAMSMHQSSVYGGTIAGGTVSGYLGQYYGWRTSFWVFGGFGLLLGLVLWFLLRDAPERTVEEKKEVVEKGTFLGHPMVYVLISVFVAANFVAMIFLTWMPSYLSRNFGMSLTMAGFSGTAYLQIASVLGVLTGGWLADRLRKRHLGGRMMTQAMGLLLGVPFLFVTGATLSVTTLVLAMTGFGFFKGLYDANIWASLYDVVPENRRASALGWMNSIGWMGGAMAPLAIGKASDEYGIAMGTCISATAAIYLAFGLLMSAGIRFFMKERNAIPVAAR